MSHHCYFQFHSWVLASTPQPRYAIYWIHTGPSKVAIGHTPNLLWNGWIRQYKAFCSDRLGWIAFFDSSLKMTSFQRNCLPFAAIILGFIVSVVRCAARWCILSISEPALIFGFFHLVFLFCRGDILRCTTVQSWSEKTVVLICCWYILDILS